MNLHIENELLFLIGLVAVVGFYMGGVARRIRLPSLIGFMFIGVFMGPSLLGWFNADNLEHLNFITHIALGFVAFGIGSELNLASLKKLGSGIIAIIFSESFTAFIVVTVGVWLLTRNIPIALLFGSVAPASAPAGTVAVIQEYKAKGNLTKALYAVVGFDDGLAILIFGFAAALAKVFLLHKLGVVYQSDGILHSMIQPTIEILGSLLVGTLLGFVFCAMAQRLKAKRDLLIMTFGIILIGTGLSTHFHLSLILTNMVIGFVLSNTMRESFVHEVTASFREVMPLLFLLFFTLAGAHLDVRALPQLGMIGLVYIITRTTGLIGGARLGASIGKVDEKVKKYVGFGILSQAGVAIGLSLILQHDLAMLSARPEVSEAIKQYAAMNPSVPGILYDPSQIAVALITTITATCIVFEIIGPILTKVALTKAGEIPMDTKKADQG